MIFRNAYEREEHKGIVVEGESLTQQHFRDDVDVNRIIERYTDTGVIADDLIHSAEGVYGDFSSVDDFTVMQNRLAHATQSFEALPSSIRERFHHSPAELIAFINDADNYEEALKLGLVNKRPTPLPEQAAETKA